MKQLSPPRNPDRRRRMRLIAGAALTGLCLIAAACSSDAQTTGSPTTTAPPAATAPPTTARPAASPSTAPPDVGIDQPQAVVAVPDVLANLGSEGFVGSVLVRTSEGEWSVGHGLADRSTGIENDVDTVFDIGSLTKQFTAAAILRLEMDGQLTVEDTIGQYVDGLSPEQSVITLHQLLTHTSGLPVGIGPDAEAIAFPEYVERLAVTPLHGAPGGAWSYSNVGYSLLGAVIEEVTGGTYEAYLRDALFEPAGMTQTGYVLADWSDATIAVGYDGDAVFGRPNEQPWDVDGPWWNLRANGGLLSSLPDLLRWHDALNGDDILDAAAKQKMYAPHAVLEEDVASYGYGWIVFELDDGRRVATHDGGNNIFYADFVRLLDDETAILLASNVADPDVFDLGTHIAEMVVPVG